MELLEKTLQEIESLDRESQKKARERLDNLAKPPGSLGVLEELVVQLAGIYRTPIPALGEKVIMVMAGDHGVVEEGVAAFPQEVTPQMVLNFLRGGAAINVLARHAGAKVVVADVGIASPPFKHPHLHNCRVKWGTDNFLKGPAMSREEAIQAIEVGIKLVQEQIEKGARLVATGEMGIGNTTPSTAILAVFSGLDAAGITGRGTGLDEEGMKIKEQVINRALAFHRPDPRDGLDVLAKVGGLEIGALAGVILGAAARRVPVLIDGFISGAGALIAKALKPLSRDYMIASHLSQEPGHQIMLNLLGLKPMLSLDMRLGEGTGAALGFLLVDAAIKCQREMATFAEAGVSKGE
ncbi:MAG: nicotinate-nucleotide--dimethylbenzimidazole phosphoribosyltransferase [Bacillota bacterium]